ncbi:MAG: class I SAM-dependent methyltransferase [Anaerolineae bacterium]
MRQELGWRDLYLFNLRLGPINFVRSVDPMRCYEYPLVIEKLDCEGGLSILDLGSGYNVLPAFVCFHTPKASVHATDIDHACASWQARYANRLRHLFGIKGMVVVQQDCRMMAYAGEAFQRVCNVSSIEHVEGDDGDTRTMQEIARVLEPQGLAVVVVPYSDRYREISWGGVFTRLYDQEALFQRLIDPSGLVLREQLFWRVNVLGQLWYKLPWIVRLPFRWLMPMISPFMVRDAGMEDLHGAKGETCVVLRKE